MNKEYIAPTEAHRKLQLARRMEQDVYLYGATGYGKTTLLKEYLDFRSYEYIDCSEPGWEEKDYSSASCVVFDQAHLVQRPEQKHVISRLLSREDVWVIISARTGLPSWIRPYQLASKLVLISEKDLHLREKEIEALVKIQNITLQKSDIDFIYKRSEGNVYVISLFLELIKEKHMSVGMDLDDMLQKSLSGFWMIM